MNSQVERRLVLWLAGELQMASLDFIVVGTRENVPTVFDTVACLYPGVPKFRVLCQGEPVPIRELKAAVTSCDLSADAEHRYEEFVQRHYAAATQRRLWEMGRQEAIQYGLPLGVYALGCTVHEKQPRAILRLNALLSPTRFLTEFKAAARS